MTECVAIIPARGGSKGIPKKNLTLVGGKPLIDWTINAAVKSNVFDAIYVTSDDEEILNHCRRFDSVICFKRKPELATDTTKSIDVLLDIIQNRELTGKICVFLQPTSPIRAYSDIKTAVQEYDPSTDGSLITVSPLSDDSLKLLIDEDGELKPLNSLWLEMPRQELPRAYKPNGAIYISIAENYIEQKKFFIEPVNYKKMDFESSIDIDDFSDVELANRILCRQ